MEKKSKIKETDIVLSEWKVTLLDDLAKRGSGHTPDKAFEEYYNGGVKWVSLADSFRLDKGLITETEYEISELGIKKSSAVIHPAGTVIISRDAGVGKSAVLGVDMAVSQHFIAWTCGEKLNNWFLYYWLQHHKGYFERQAVGSTIKTIGLPLFKKLSIKHPGYDEQKAIADCLLRFDNFIEKNNQLIIQKELQKKWLMQQLLTGKKRNAGFTKEWKEVKLGDVAKMRSGGTPASTNKEYYGNSIPWAVIADLTKADKYLFETSKGITKQGLQNSSAVIFPPGTILFAMYASIGKCVITQISTTCNQAILGIEPHGVLNEYLYYILRMNEFKYTKMGQSGTQNNLNKEMVENFNLRIPEIDEQIVIAKTLRTADKEIHTIKAKLEKVNEQKRALMQSLITGKKALKIK